ncbi:MAG: hypothetical protein D6726_01885 [Nitrospirae bacterium]|nr:MAG: hypothetical protein D6726_01885 [Nitrospirota bacterium]
MKLGILVNTEDHADDVIGITRAAVEKGHEVVIFTMDVGTRLFEKEEYASLCNLQGVEMSLCDHSAKYAGAKIDGLSDAIVCGSQYNNAAMLHDADKVIVL